MARPAAGRYAAVHQPPPRMGDTVTLFVDRCVMCTRCVRFTREIAGTSELMVINRGAHEEIDVFPGYPLDNKIPATWSTFARSARWGTRNFSTQQRVWFMKTHDNVCAGCSTGCSIKVEENQDRIYRLQAAGKPLHQPVVDVRRRPLRLEARARRDTA